MDSKKGRLNYSITPPPPEGFSLDHNDILEYQVNRYPYLFIDKVEWVIPGKSAVGYKNLTYNEWYFPVHFPGDFCMPGFLQAEALTQMCALTILTLEGNKGKKVLLLSANNLKLYKKVRPGDRLVLKTELLSYRRGIANGKGVAYVGGRAVSSLEMGFTLADSEERRRLIPKGEDNDSKG
jgi:3-hydroxyacyl-[acyl-carrier-protein] dehydratase